MPRIVVSKCLERWGKGSGTFQDIPVKDYVRGKLQQMSQEEQVNVLADVINLLVQQEILGTGAFKQIMHAVSEDIELAGETGAEAYPDE